MTALDRWRRARDRRILGIRGLVPPLLAVGMLLVAVAVMAGVGVVHALSLQRRVAGLPATIKAVEAEVAGGQLAQAQTTLASAADTLASVNSALFTSPDFRVLDVLPVARQNLAAVRSGVHLGLELLGDGQSLLSAAARIESPTGHLEVSFRDGQAPVSAVHSVQKALAAVTPDLRVPPRRAESGLLLGPVRNGLDKLYAAVARTGKDLTAVQDGLGVLDEFTGGAGDRRYLIAVANTAEMRGAGGMILSYGVLDATGGKVSLGGFGPIDDLKLNHPAPATFPSDFEATFGPLQPNRYWRNTTIMPDFTVDAPVLAAMYTQATGKKVDGVIQVDPAGLGALLAGIGPVDDPQLGLVTAANVVPLTLNAAYVDFPFRPVRQEYLAGVAREAFAAFTSRPIPSLRPLATALGTAARDRHIVVWSDRPSVEAEIAALGYAGALPTSGDFAQLSIENFGGDKLDFYLQSALAITGTHPGGGPPGHVQATITLDNQAPPGGRSRYVFGPYTPGSSDPPGLYRGLVTLYLPPGSRLTGTSSQGATTLPPQPNTQNGLSAFTYYVTIPAGGQVTTTLDLTLAPRPRGPEHFEVVPTPRINPTVATISVS
ncbi:MAG: DUF4012 domain-containing protein [Acidimicrobiales bacterium]